MIKKAYTLIELLVVIVLTLIIMTSVYLTISNLFYNESDLLEKAKRNIDSNISFLVIDKLIRSTGFGIDKSINENIKVDNNTITFKTLMGNDTESGSWEICPQNGIRNSLYPAVVLDDKKNKKGFLDKNDTNCTPGTLIFKCKDNGSSCEDPYYYESKIYLGGTAETNCAPGTQNLLLNSGNTRILSCVGDFKVKYDDDKKLLYIGIVVQSSNRKKGELDKPYSYNIDFNNKSIDLSHIENYNKYSWNIIENIIYLENLK